MELHSNLWFMNKEKGYFGKGRIELLDQIDRMGSISKAAKVMKMSYKAAWDAVNEMNALSSEPIVVRETGGKGGGGTVLTDKGREYIILYKQIEQTQALFFKALGDYADDPQKLLAFTSKLTLRTSARNQLQGSVIEVKKFKTRAEIRLKIAPKVEVMVVITTKSLIELDIQQNSELYILIKSSWIKLVKQVSHREANKNYLLCQVQEIEVAEESVEVILALDAKNLLVVTLDKSEFDILALSIKGSIWAVFETSSALLAV
ncbi:MAG: LysR family transcriptional regulator [Epsilonproteobacteria bacterium]|nr:LysR family transcriptional regulator [Campylobacterota bacterium]